MDYFLKKIRVAIAAAACTRSNEFWDFDSRILLQWLKIMNFVADAFKIILTGFRAVKLENLTKYYLHKNKIKTQPERSKSFLLLRRMKQ